MTYYKGFDKDLKCRGMQFEVGKTYDTRANDEDVELCSDTAIHFCDSLQNVHDYYSQNPDANNRVCEVEPLGKIVSSDTKMGQRRTGGLAGSGTDICKIRLDVGVYQVS